MKWQASTRVECPRGVICFPCICPHCLRNAEAWLKIKSPGYKKYYIFWTVSRHLVEDVRFCSQFTKRLLAVKVLCGVIAAVAFIIGIAANFEKGSAAEAQYWWGFIICASIGFVVTRPFMPTYYARIAGYDEQNVEFVFRNPSYAKMFIDMNLPQPTSDANSLLDAALIDKPEPGKSDAPKHEPEPMYVEKEADAKLALASKEIAAYIVNSVTAKPAPYIPSFQPHPDYETEASKQSLLEAVKEMKKRNRKLDS